MQLPLVNCLFYFIFPLSKRLICCLYFFFCIFVANSAGQLHKKNSEFSEYIFFPPVRKRVICCFFVLICFAYLSAAPITKKNLTIYLFILVGFNFVLLYYYYYYNFFSRWWAQWLIGQWVVSVHCCLRCIRTD